MDHDKRLIRRREEAPAAEIKREEGSPATEMISQDGVLNEKGLEEFMKLHDCGVSYAVVAIMGPQSSGKSTLLNHLFHTNFSEMDASIGRGKTTKGMWIAKAVDTEPCIMVMDVEGTDGQERGQDGTTFEKRSALFALVVSDIFFINMWCNEIGRENAANRPLLKTIFEVMMQIFPSSRRKATLHFIIRDKTKTPIEALQTQLRKNVEETWNTVTKTENFKDTPLREIFNVEVDALPHYEYAENEFKTEVSKLRGRVLNSIREAGNRGDVIPTSGLPLHVKELWETIKQNKQLDLPTHKKMVATMRCEEIAEEQLKLFASDEEWLKLKAEAIEGLVPGFGAKLELIWSRYLTAYDSESKYYQEGVRNAKRQYLESKVFDEVNDAYKSTLDHLRAEVLTKFKSMLEQALNEGRGYAESVASCRLSCEEEFDKRCLDAVAISKQQSTRDASFVRKELTRDINNHALLVRTEKFTPIVEKCQAPFATKITTYLNNLFIMLDEAGVLFTWAHIRSFMKRECDSAASALCSDIASFQLDQKAHSLMESAKKLVVDKFKKETGFVLHYMKKRFVLSLYMKEDLETAYSKCLKVLSTMAAIRLEESPSDGEEVERLLVSALIQGDKAVSLGSCTWEKVPAEMTLITPTGCEDIWKQFQLDTQTTMEQIRAVDKLHGNSETPANYEMLTNSKTSKLSGNSETPESQSETVTQLPFWAKVGALLLGVTHFVLLLCRQDYASAAVFAATLAVNVVELCMICPEKVKETVKNYTTQVKDGCKKGYKRMKRTYLQIMKKLEEALKKYYNFMMGIFPKKTVVEVIS